MNELSYLVTLTESLSNAVNSAGSESKKKFLTKIFQLFINDRRLPNMLPLGRGEAQVYKSSLKLLFARYHFDDLVMYVKEFRRDENPELLPAYELVLSSADVNELGENVIQGFFRELRNSLDTDVEKNKLLIHFLFGSHPLAFKGLNDYPLLINQGVYIFDNAINELRRELVKSFAERWRRFYRSGNPHPFNNVITELRGHMLPVMEENPDLLEGLRWFYDALANREEE